MEGLEEGGSPTSKLEGKGKVDVERATSERLIVASSGFVLKLDEISARSKFVPHAEIGREAPGPTSTQSGPCNKHELSSGELSPWIWLDLVAARSSSFHCRNPCLQFYDHMRLPSQVAAALATT